MDTRRVLGGIVHHSHTFLVEVGFHVYLLSAFVALRENTLAVTYFGVTSTVLFINSSTL